MDLDEDSPGVTVTVAPSAAAIGPLAADRLAKAIARSPTAYLGMATGSTPRTTAFFGTSSGGVSPTVRSTCAMRHS